MNSLVQQDTLLDKVIAATDSYKVNHWNQYPHDTEHVYSYFESRVGAKFPYTVFFGLQYLLKRYLVGTVVDWSDIANLNELANAHFGHNNYFNYTGWAYIKEEHGGRLPIRIKAVPEGTPVPTGNVLMTIENTDPKCFWLTNYVESLLTHVWYPSTVATLSRYTIDMMRGYLERTADTLDALPFMLNDFGYRGASSHESAAVGGMAHVVNSQGTDTIPGLTYAKAFYGADYSTLAFSVAATEHSVMTAQGEDGEFDVVAQLLDEHPTGITSCVGDSYDIYRFVTKIGTDFKERILARDGVFVVRPDSITKDHTTPEALTHWIVDTLWRSFGGTLNQKGFKVLDPHVRVLWGDGIGPDGIEKILDTLRCDNYSAENMVFGMGGGLLQKVNRDTQRFAFKASAIKRGGEWHDIHKKPLDESKASKKGRLALAKLSGEYCTIDEGGAIPLLAGNEHNVLETVFEDGKLVKEYTFDQVRECAKLS